MTERFHYFEGREALSRAAAAFIVEAAEAAIDARGRFTLVLAGGSTPGRAYEWLAVESDMPWPEIHLFIGDERFVAPDDPESNLRMIREHMISRIEIPDQNLHFVDTTMTSAEEAAERYERALADFFGGPPEFDLLLLGMGPDGHSASLFPETPPPEAERLVMATTAPPSYPTRSRVTLTPSALDAAKRVLFLVAGEDKAEAFSTIRNGDRASLPAGRVRAREELVWYVDQALV